MAVILDNKAPRAASVFQPDALLREARRQKALPAIDVPAICILDPDGDIVRRLRREGRARPFEAWPCYHTELDNVRTKWANGRHRRMRGRRAIRRAYRRGAVCERLPLAPEPHVRGTDRARRPTAIFCHHR